MSLSALAVVALLQAGAPYCPQGHSQAECNAVWAASQAYANSVKAVPQPTRGTSVRSWHPDQGTTCTEVQNGSAVRRSVIYISNDSSHLNDDPSPAFWEAMGCTLPVHAAEPATWDSVFAKVDQATAIEERRKARAAAKGIRLCERAEFLSNMTDCVRRSRLADAP